jgi:hypothetical protein
MQREDLWEDAVGPGREVEQQYLALHKSSDIQHVSSTSKRTAGGGRTDEQGPHVVARSNASDRP